MNARTATPWTALALLLSAAPGARGFNGHRVTEGPLTVTIADIGPVRRLDAPQDVTVALASTASAELSVKLRLTGLVDECRSVGPAERTVTVPPGKSATASFRFAVGKGAHSALYPVHVQATFARAGRQHRARAVQIFQTDFARRGRGAGGGSDKPDKLPLVTVAPDAAVPLTDVREARASWRYHDKPLFYMPVGWTGSARPSSASFTRSRAVARGSIKPALQIHPPWRPSGGTIFVDYRLSLPARGPVRLTFANAIRDHTADEPPSDGVTFRVWAGADEASLVKLFDRHTDSKKWLDGQADLSRFAGRQILLRLESHPGPKRNTTCDSCFWGEPTVVAGQPHPQLTEDQRTRLRERAAEIVRTQKAAGDGAFAFRLAGGCTAAVVLGPAGLADGALALGRGRKCVAFDGLRLAVMGHPVGRWPSSLTVAKADAARLASGAVALTHHCRLAGEPLKLTMELRPAGAGLQLRVACDKRITDLAIGPADRTARRVYYGHGYCIDRPKAFRAGFGGHNLSTSHVGFDFAGGLSLLTACDNPPDYLEVDPARRVYALHTHMNATLTFVPSTAGAFDCAVRYRPLYDKKPAGGFRRKAGRFVFDIWGGRYAEIAETMGRMVDYGLTDSLLTVHVWQRWGYDYRLPDIHPPLPSLGTAADVRKIADVCKRHDIPWGLHDNYIDFYPDAEGYSYGHICFTPGGEPIKAWINRSRDAQSYRWRPDRFMPFLQRNLKLIKPSLRPTHYFIDVFTSIGCFDFYDRQGRFHSSLETRRCWGEAFAWIRDYLGGSAPMTSEAGHDQLTGYLDGADCQHLQLTLDSKRFCIRLPCADWQRTPWFGAVLHDKFSLHGVGYSSRYQGGRPRREAGIESDDYISAEVLLGHALMIDRGAFGRGAVRKYWLAQDFIRSIATDTIAAVEFAGGDIHRQTVTWTGGARVHVNRGRADWRVAGRVLPQYGYYAANGRIESSIERLGGVIVERSAGPSGLYVNGRGFDSGGELPITPIADRVEHLGGNRFRLIVNWQADRPAPKDLAVFLHFTHEKSDRSDRIVFQGDFAPATPTSKWAGRVTTGGGRTVYIPEAADQREYDVVVGMWDPRAGRRYPLRGEDVGSSAYRIGRLVIERTGNKVTGVSLVKRQAAPPPPPRWNVAGRPVDFGPIVTAGALRCTVAGGRIVLTALPDVDGFTVAVRPKDLTAGKLAEIESVQAIDRTGRAIRTVEHKTQEGVVTLRTKRGEFAYELR